MFSPNQVIRVRGEWFEVSSVNLGAVNQVSLIGLKPLTEREGSAYGQTIKEMFVPEIILEKAIAGGATLYDPKP